MNVKIQGIVFLGSWCNVHKVCKILIVQLNGYPVSQFSQMTVVGSVCLSSLHRYLEARLSCKKLLFLSPRSKFVSLKESAMFLWFWRSWNEAAAPWDITIRYYFRINCQWRTEALYEACEHPFKATISWDELIENTFQRILKTLKFFVSLR